MRKQVQNELHLLAVLLAALTLDLNFRILQQPFATQRCSEQDCLFHFQSALGLIAAGAGQG